MLASENQPRDYSLSEINEEQQQEEEEYEGVTDGERFSGEGLDGDAAADGGEKFPETVNSHCVCCCYFATNALAG